MYTEALDCLKRGPILVFSSWPKYETRFWGTEMSFERSKTFKKNVKKPLKSSKHFPPKFYDCFEDHSASHAKLL